MNTGKEVCNKRVSATEAVDQNKENLHVFSGTKFKAPSSPFTRAANNEALTKVRKKAPPPSPLNLVATPSFTPAAEQVNLPPYVTSLPPTTNSFSTEFSSLSLASMTPPFTPNIPPPPFVRNHQPPPISAVVELPGFINLKLRHDMVLSISSNLAVLLKNLQKQSSLSMSSCSTQMAVVHPKGRLLQYGYRIEVQVEDDISVKNAKIFPRGLSFTANNMALVYLLDEAGARSTSDTFHDLHATDIADTLFKDSLGRQVDGVTTSIRQLDMARYWRTRDNVDCWIIGQIFIQQMEDGLVVIEKNVENDKIIVKSSPSNGKVKVDSQFVHVTASLGAESHMFIRSMNRRLHYSGETKVFTVRNAGHSAGFDEEGSLRIF